MLIDPKQPKRVYAADDTTLYRSEDAGQTWQPAANGLPAGGVTDVALDPRQPERLYAATADGALYLSEDGATTWRLPATTDSDAAS
ncbi:MAG: WD40/YVTN/BNR-like repeat-containing protein [Dehalococcoidia bacterium]